MAIPEYTEKFYRAILEALSDGEIHTNEEIRDSAASWLGVNDKDREKKFPSLREGYIYNSRVNGALSDLKKAQLVENPKPKKGYYRLTEKGKRIISDCFPVLLYRQVNTESPLA